MNLKEIGFFNVSIAKPCYAAVAIGSKRVEYLATIRSPDKL